MKLAKKRPAGMGEPVMVRIQPDLKKMLDDWRRLQYDIPGRAEAIRRLVEIGLSHQPLEPGKPHRGAARAKEMALSAMKEHMPGVPDDERLLRKQRLLKTPGQSKP